MERIIRLIKSKKPQKWLFYGDSITQGCYHTFGHRDFTELFAERIRFEMGRRHDVIINTAISGDTSGDLYDTFDWRVSQFYPDVVFIMVGTNDCEDQNHVTISDFKNNLLKLISEVNNIGAQPVLQTPCKIRGNQNAAIVKRFFDFVDIVREVGITKGVPIIDHARHWEENADKAELWMNDEMHPNHYGHRVLANYIFECMSMDETNFTTSNLFVPKT